MSYSTLSPVAGRIAAGRRFTLILAAGLAMSLPLVGCDQDNASAQAISKATRDLEALVPGGVQPGSDAYRAKVYNDVVTTLRPVADKGNKNQAAAASLLVSQAHAGLAERPAQDASELERACLNRILGIQAELSQWYSDNAMADAAASFNPADELAAIDKTAKERQEQRVAAQNQKSQVDSKVAELREQAKAKVVQARAKQEEAGTLRSQVANQTAVEGEATLKRAQVIGRQGDALSVEGSMLEAQAAQVAPKSGAIQLEIDRLTNQLELLDAARADVMARAQTAKANAASSRASAAKAAEAIKTQLAELEELRSGELEKKNVAAIAGYESAASAAAKAVGDSRTTAQMAAGSARQSLGDVQWTKAHGLSSYATLLETLGQATPALPESGAYATKAAEVRAAAKAALDAATDAYEAANAAYEASGSAKAAERIQRVNAMLAKIVNKTSGGAKDIRSVPSEGGGDATPAPAAPAAAIDPDSPQGAVQAFLDAAKAKEFGRLISYFHFESDADRQMMTSVLAVAPKFERLNDAMKAKFGQGMDGAGAQAGMGGVEGMNFSKLENLSASDFRFTVEGDSAEASPPAGEAMKLTKRDGKWLIDNPMAGAAVDPQQMAMVQAMMPAMGKVAEDLAAEVEAGKYPTLQAAMAAMQQKMMQAMMPGGGR